MQVAEGICALWSIQCLVHFLAPVFGPFLGTSPLKLDINDATPLPKFLFDFVPCPIKQTFSIRSHYNQKYLRYIDDEHLHRTSDEEYQYRYSNSNSNEEIDDSFQVDANKKTATEFTLSPIRMSYAYTTKTELR